MSTNARQELAGLINTLQDGRMIAEASRDFFKARYDGLAEVAAYVTNPEEMGKTDSSYENLLIVVESSSGATYCTTVGRLRNAIKSFYNSSNQIADADPLIGFVDLDNQYYQVQLQQVATSIGQQLDNLYITYTAFDSLTADLENSANDFANSVMLYAKDKSQTIATALTEIFKTLRNTAGSITDRVNALLEFSGVKRFIDDPSTAKTLEQGLVGCYTGATPYASLMSGALQLAMDAGGAYISMVKLQLTIGWKILCGTMIYMGKSLLNIGKFLHGWYSSNFVNPTDYEIVDGSDSVKCFSIPGRLKVQCSRYYGAIDGSTGFASAFRPLGVYYAYLMNSGRDAVTNFSLFGSYYRIEPSYASIDYIDTSTQKEYKDVTSLNVYRWLRPVDIQKVMAIISSNIDTDRSQITYAQLRNALVALQTSDLSLSKGASEKQLMYGAVVAHIMDSFFTQAMYGTYTDDAPSGSYNYLQLISTLCLVTGSGARFSSTLNNSGPINWNAKVAADESSITSDTDRLFYRLLVPLTLTLNTLCAELQADNWNGTSFYFYRCKRSDVQVKVSDVMKLISEDYYASKVVTNKVLLRVATMMPYIMTAEANGRLQSLRKYAFYDSAGSVYDAALMRIEKSSGNAVTQTLTESIKKQISPNDSLCVYKNRGSDATVDDYYTENGVAPVMGALALWNWDRMTYLCSDANRIVTIGYHNGEYNVPANVRIKSDEDNVQNMMNAFKSALITTGVVISTAYLGVKTIKLYRYINQGSAQLNALNMRYGQAMLDGDSPLANKLWKDRRTLQRKLMVANLAKGSLLGGVAAAASSLQDVVQGSQITNAKIDLSPVTKGMDDLSDKIGKLQQDMTTFVEQVVQQQNNTLITAMATQSALDLAETLVMLNAIKSQLSTMERSSSLNNNNGNW